MDCPRISKVIDGKRYNTETATCIADDVYWDGNNFERGGRNQFLFRTKKGNYFVVTGSFWQGERDTLQPLSQEEALEWWKDLEEKNVSFEEAFPEITVEDA